MGMKLVLDTNIYCDYAEGRHEVIDVIATRGDEILIPAVVIGELTFGFLKGSRYDFNQKKLQQIIKKLAIEIIDVNMDVARKYAFIYRALSKKGKPIPINDVWISACCMQAGGTLLTRDGHFRFVDQIESIIIS